MGLERVFIKDLQCQALILQFNTFYHHKIQILLCPQTMRYWLTCEILFSTCLDCQNLGCYTCKALQFSCTQQQSYLRMKCQLQYQTLQALIRFLFFMDRYMPQCKKEVSNHIYNFICCDRGYRGIQQLKSCVLA